MTWSSGGRLSQAGRGSVLLLTTAAVLVGCGRDEGSADTLPPPSILTTAIPATSPAPATTSPPAPTTVVSATSAQVASTSSTSTASTTSTTSTTVASTTTTVAPAAQLVLGADRLGTALFGAEPEAVISYLSAVLGPPLADSGWADPNSAFGVCPGTEVRGVTWGDLLVLFSDASTVATGRRHFFAYSLGPPVGSTINPAGMTTPEGIGVGSSVAELRAAYPGVYLYGGDDIFEPYFVVSEQLTGFLSGDTDSDTVQAVIGGIACGE